MSTLKFTGNGYPTRPSIAWIGNSVIVTASYADSQDYNEALYYWWRAAGTSTWNAEAVGDGFSAPPQIAGSPTWQADYNYDTYSVMPLYPAIAPAGATAITAFANYVGHDSSDNPIQYLYYGWQPTPTSWTVEEVDSSTRIAAYSDGTPSSWPAPGRSSRRPAPTATCMPGYGIPAPASSPGKRSRP
jgi:hypothetical protein